MSGIKHIVKRGSSGRFIGLDFVRGGKRVLPEKFFFYRVDEYAIYYYSVDDYWLRVSYNIETNTPRINRVQDIKMSDITKVVYMRK